VLVTAWLLYYKSFEYTIRTCQISAQQIVVKYGKKPSDSEHQIQGLRSLHPNLEQLFVGLSLTEGREFSGPLVFFESISLLALRRVPLEITSMTKSS